MMFKSFRVAGLAAAAAFLCAHVPAAAQPASPLAETAVTTAVPADFSIRPDAATVPSPLGTNAPIAARPTLSPVPAPVPADATIPAPASSAVRPAVVEGARRSLSDLVSEHAASDTDDEQFDCLARAVYFESRGEPLEGQLAVAEVILNRVASGRFRSTICDVVRQPSQFSFVRRGQIPSVPRDNAAWHRAVAIARIALDNLHDVTGDDSLFFHATYVRPNWGRPRIARIGRHIFYR